MTAIKFRPFFELIHLIDDAESTKVTYNYTEHVLNSY